MLIEVSLYTDEMLEIALNTATYYNIHNFSKMDDTIVKDYLEDQFQIGRALEDSLTKIYKHHVFVSDAELSGDNWSVLTDFSSFSDAFLLHILRFLSARKPNYAVLLSLCEDMEIDGCPEIGRMVINLRRIGVPSVLQNAFLKKCKRSLRQVDGILFFNAELS